LFVAVVLPSAVGVGVRRALNFPLNQFSNYLAQRSPSFIKTRSYRFSFSFPPRNPLPILFCDSTRGDSCGALDRVLSEWGAQDDGSAMGPSFVCHVSSPSCAAPPASPFADLFVPLGDPVARQAFVILTAACRAVGDTSVLFRVCSWPPPSRGVSEARFRPLWFPLYFISVLPDQPSRSSARPKLPLTVEAYSLPLQPYSRSNPPLNPRVLPYTDWTILHPNFSSRRYAPLIHRRIQPNL